MRRIQILDYARLFAAVSVMCFHYLFNGINNGKVPTLSAMPEIAPYAIFGYLGVDFFFIISGFVIAFSYAGKTPGSFLSSRMIRMLPAFWAGVLFTTCVAALIGSGDFIVTPAQALANLTMVPQVFDYEFADGVYWTLQYEIAFYALIFGLMLLGNGRGIDRFLMLWPWMMAVALVLGLNKIPYMGGYFTYFAAGAVLARWDQWPRLLGICTLIVAIALSTIWGVTKAQGLAMQRGIEYPAPIIAALILAMFVFFLLLRHKRISTLELPGASIAGGITYPLYLVHAHFGYMVFARYGSDANKAWLIPAVMAGAVAIALAIHLVVERAMRPFWSRASKLLIESNVDRARAAALSRFRPKQPLSPLIVESDELLQTSVTDPLIVKLPPVP